MTREEQIQEILDAIEKKEYKISYDEPGSVSFCEFKNGSKFFYVSGDDCKYGMDCGSCTIEVAGHEYTCNLGNGDWDGSDDLIEEYEVEDAISDIPEMWTSAFDDDESIVSYYCFCNGIKEKYPIVDDEEELWEDDEDEDWEEEDGDESIDFDNYDAKSFEGITYAVLDEPEDYEEDGKGGFFSLAIAYDTDMDEDGYYPCVSVHLNQDYEIIEVEDSDERYDALELSLVD